MSGYELPTALEVGGVEYAIRTDWRDVLYLLGLLSGGGYEPDEQAGRCGRRRWTGRWSSSTAACCRRSGARPSG